MNIFYLHSNPQQAVKYMYDKHIVKMILESAQILCTAHHETGSTAPYKPAYVNHPSTVWARTSKEHYMWLYTHFIALGDEYTKRYNRVHSTITKCADPLRHVPKNIPYAGFTPPPQCMPDQYKIPKATVLAYWNYYIKDKHRIATKSETPITQRWHNSYGQYIKPVPGIIEKLGETL